MKLFTRLVTVVALSSVCIAESAAAGLLRSMDAVFESVSSSSAIISEQPEGTEHLYSRSGGAYYAVMGNVRMTVFDGVEARFIEGTDGFWYLYSALSQADTQSYMKFEKLADGSLVANLPQAAVIGMVDDKEVTLELNKMEYTVLSGSGANQEATYKVVSSDNKIVYTLGDDGVWTMEDSGDGQTILGLTDEAGNWYGYGEFNTRFVPFNYELVTPPADLETQTWSMTYGDDGNNVNIGFSGSEVYFQGLIRQFPEAWVKGELADGKITVESNQYIGIEPNEVHYCFFSGADVEEVWNEYYEIYVDKFVPNDAIVFDYDADNKTMELNGGFVATTLNNSTVYSSLGVKNPKLILVTGEVSQTPANPVITLYEPYDDIYQMAALEFDFPKVNVDGILLSTSKLYYRIYADGGIFVFTPAEYSSLKRPMNLVPYGFEDKNADFSALGISHTVFFFRDVQHVGVQTVYRDSVGNEHCSDIVYTDSSALGSIDGSAKVVSETIFDLSGRPVVEPAKGVCIRRSVLSNGETITSKFIVR